MLTAVTDPVQPPPPNSVCGLNVSTWPTAARQSNAVDDSLPTLTDAQVGPCDRSQCSGGRRSRSICHVMLATMPE
jgi:hypothetical protein